MSTRGAWGFLKKDKHKVTYNHSDSYPEWLGNQMLTYLGKTDVKKLNAIFKDIILVDEHKVIKPNSKALQRFIERAGADNAKLLKPAPIGFGSGKKDWYYLLRDCQGDPDGVEKLGLMPDNFEFLGDGLFCEWAYIINLDTEEFEVYRGFYKEKKPDGRYADIWPKNEDGYYPVGLFATYPLDALPEKFSKETTPEFFREDEDEEAAA